MIQNNVFFVMVLFRACICNGEGRSMRMLYTQKYFGFLQKWTVVLGNFESHVSLLRFHCSNHAYGGPALTPSPPPPS